MAEILELNFDHLWYDKKTVTLVRALNVWVRCAFGSVCISSCSKVVDLFYGERNEYWFEVHIPGAPGHGSRWGLAIDKIRNAIVIYQVCWWNCSREGETSDKQNAWLQVILFVNSVLKLFSSAGRSKDFFWSPPLILSLEMSPLATWQCFKVEPRWISCWQSDNMTTWQHDDKIILQHDNMTTWQCYKREPRWISCWQPDNLTIGHSDNNASRGYQGWFYIL